MQCAWYISAANGKCSAGFELGNLSDMSGRCDSLSKTSDDHLRHLTDVFDRFREANIKLKPSKCVFGQQKVNYLGHIISQGGIEPDPEKVRLVQDVPKTVRQVRSFLGLANYYRRFVKDFAKIASPLNALTKETSVFWWDSHCDEAFEALKQRLTQSPILACPNYELPFYLYVDASLDALGATLGQVQRKLDVVVAYDGHKLPPRSELIRPQRERP